MAFAICIVPVCPLRAEASHRSEMVSQLLLGESGTVLEESGDFVKLSCLHDGYEGWCQHSQLVIQETLPGEPNSHIYVSDWIDKVAINGVNAYVPMGTPVISPVQTELPIGPYKLHYLGTSPWNAAIASPTPEAVTVRAYRFLNTPYLWGGRSVFGIDCSGFTQMVFRFFHIALMRDAYLQATQGEVVGFLQEAHCGDLAFFDNAEGKITHVGILLNDHEIIHASGKVRIDKIDNFGIINTDTGKRTHSLRIIKRYF